MEPQLIVSSLDAGIVLLRLNRPSRRNALTVSLIASLGQALAHVGADPKMRCAVLTGDKRAFSAGADIEELVAGGFPTLERPERRSGWAGIEGFEKPLLAAAEGLAFGGGLELLMLADIAIVGRSTRFALPEIKIGLIPGYGGTQRLPRLVGRALASRMILTGEPVDANTALAAGLVAEVVGDGEALERTIELAKVIAAGASGAQRLAKAALRAADAMALAAGTEMERQLSARAFSGPDQHEGMKAFLEKRTPKFTELS